MSTEIFFVSLAAIAILIPLWLAGFRKMKDAQPPEPDEHEVMVRPRDKQGRWVKEGDGLVAKHGPGTPWQRGKK